jgi:hypothetical protein
MIPRTYELYYYNNRTHRSLNRMRLSLVQFGGPEPSNRTPFLADFTNTCGFRFLVHAPSEHFRLNRQPLKVGWRGCTQSLKSAKSFHAGSGGSQPDRGA